MGIGGLSGRYKLGEADWYFKTVTGQHHGNSPFFYFSDHSAARIIQKFDPVTPAQLHNSLFKSVLQYKIN